MLGTAGPYCGELWVAGYPCAPVLGGEDGREARTGRAYPRGTRTVLSRHTFHHTYRSALAKLGDPAALLRPTAKGALQALRDGGPQRVDQLATRLAANGRRPVRPATVMVALEELRAATLAADDQSGVKGTWSALPAARDPLLDAVDLHAPTTSATPSPPGSRTPASALGSSMR